MDKGRIQVVDGFEVGLDVELVEVRRNSEGGNERVVRGHGDGLVARVGVAVSFAVLDWTDELGRIRDQAEDDVGQVDPLAEDLAVLVDLDQPRARGPDVSLPTRQTI